MLFELLTISVIFIGTMLTISFIFIGTSSNLAIHTLEYFKTKRNCQHVVFTTNVVVRTYKIWYTPPPISPQSPQMKIQDRWRVIIIIFNLQKYLCNTLEVPACTLKYRSIYTVLMWSNCSMGFTLDVSSVNEHLLGLFKWPIQWAVNWTVNWVVYMLSTAVFIVFFHLPKLI